MWGNMVGIFGDEDKTEQQITITYDTLFEILRKEKVQEDLQKLHEGFFQDVVTYLVEKKAFLQQKKEQSSLFEQEEHDKTVRQLDNIRRLLKELYERREKKIITMSLNRSRFKDSVIDTSSLLPEERMLYDTISALLSQQRGDVLHALLQGQIPQQLNAFTGPASPIQAVSPQPGIPAQPTRLLRFLTAVPAFMGEDMQEYGPFDEEDVAKLPKEIAEILVSKERAEEITEG